MKLLQVDDRREKRQDDGGIHLFDTDERLSAITPCPVLTSGEV
jgi:hypothetical protein